MRISDWSSDVCSSDLLFRHRALQVANYRGEVATAHVDIDPGRGPCVLGLEHRRPFGDRNIRHRAQRDLLSRRGQDRQAAQPFEAVAQLTRIAPADRVAGKTFDRSEEQTSELQSLIPSSYAVFCLK